MSKSDERIREKVSSILESIGIDQRSLRKTQPDKYQLVIIGIELGTIDTSDVMYIVDDGTSYSDAQRRLTTKRVRSCSVH